MLKNGDESQKKDAKKYLEKQKMNKDEQAITILNEYEKNNPTEKQPK